MLSDSHVTSLHWLLSNATFIDWRNAPNPLAFETKPTICGSEHKVVFVKKHSVAFNIDALVNVNLFSCKSTRGAAYDTCGAGVTEVSLATEATIVGWTPAPQVVLHCSEEWEVQSVPVQDVPDSDMRVDAEAWPYTPITRSVELPVEAKMSGDAELMEGQA